MSGLGGYASFGNLQLNDMPDCSRSFCGLYESAATSLTPVVCSHDLWTRIELYGDSHKGD